MKNYFLMLFIIFPILACAQDHEAAAVEEVINNLFKGMYEGDSSMVHTSFSDEVRMYSTFKTPEGEEVLRAGSLEGFLKAIGTPHDQVWDERISDLSIEVDAGLAHAWMEYEFYAGEKFSHCGVNAMQLVRIEGHWKIIHLIDTRKKETCEAWQK